MPPALTLSQVKDLFAHSGASLISETYKNASTPLEYLCYCGSKTVATTTVYKWTHHKKPHKCNFCPGLKKFPKKLDYDDVKKVFAAGGCVMISETYESTKKPVEFLCSCGNKEVCSVTVATFKLYGTNCKVCRSDRLKATNFERHGVEYMGDKNEEMKKRMLSGITKYVEEKKHKYSDVKAKFESKGLELLEEDYVNCITHMRYRCGTCGNLGKITYDTLLRGRGCSWRQCINMKIFETNMKRYGHLLYNCTLECKEKVKETDIERYRSEINKIFNERSKKNQFEKYGSWYSQTDECKNKIISTNMIRYGFPCSFQSELVKDKIKKGCLERYGVEFYSQVDFVKEKMKKKNLERYGFTVCSKNTDVKEKMKATNLERYGVSYTLQCEIIRDKALQTIIMRYGVDNVSKVASIQAQKKVTSNVNYGVDYPMQNETIASRSSMNMLKLKIFTLPSGKEIVYQGYENIVLRELVNRFDDNNIITDRKLVPEIWYTMDDGQYRRYFIDIYIPEINCLIEVKSTYTLQLDGVKIDYKRKICEYLGYKFVLYLYDDKKQLINHTDVMSMLE
jgi:hypothetical protein